MFCYLLLCDLLVFINYKDIAAKFLPNLLLSSDAINLLFIYWDFLIIFFTLIAEALNFYLDFALKANIESVVCLQTHFVVYFSGALGENFLCSLIVFIFLLQDLKHAVTVVTRKIYKPPLIFQSSGLLPENIGKKHLLPWKLVYVYMHIY